MAYQLFTNRWDNPAPIEEIPVTGGFDFSYPVSDHGEANWTATVAPGKADWRKSLSTPLSGVLVCSNGVPIWDGWITADDKTGPRTFSFRAREWGYIFEAFRQTSRVWYDDNDHQIFRDLIESAQMNLGQDVGIVVPVTEGAHNSSKTINAWDNSTVGTEFREVADADGGPEWYFGVTGSMSAPTRQLYLSDQHGTRYNETSPVLEYVDATEEEEDPHDPLVVLLGDVFGYGPSTVRVRRGGGNVIAQGRARNVDNATTVAIAVDGASEAAQRRALIQAYDLLVAGWPKLTRFRSYSEYQTTASLAAHARADLNAARGIATGYSLVTLEGNPDWSQVTRGSDVRVVLDTDEYDASRPIEFTTPLRNMVVRVPSTGTPQIEWRVADVLEA